jgi:HEAT repeat protein
MKHKGLWITSGVLAAAALAMFLEPNQTVIGRLCGDAFFQGRPTRYWVRSLRGGPGQQAEASSRLRQGGAEAVPVLAAMLSGTAIADDAEVRYTSAELLSKLGSEASSAGPALLAGVHDRDAHVQTVCAAALPKAGVPAKTAVPVLTGLLKSKHAVVAAQALSEYRGAAAESLPALVELLESKTQTTEARWNAARTIGKIGPAAASAVPVLIAALDDPEWTIREHCSEAIGDFGPGAAPEAIPGLIRMLADSVARVRRDAVRSLGQIGRPALESVPEIKKLLSDPEENVRKAARTALVKIAPEQAPPAANPDAKSAEPVSSPK